MKIVDNISIPPEIVRKPLVFLTFSESIEMESRYVCRKTPSMMFDWVLNTPLHSSSSSSSADVLFLYPLKHYLALSENMSKRFEIEWLDF